jgi:hypothetical protein
MVGAGLAPQVSPKLSQSYPAEAPAPGRGNVALVTRSGLYIGIILAVAVGAAVYGLRTYSIFSCQPSIYGPDRYLSYCNATGYGDYDHGAIWFGLEPAVNSAASSAQVLFLGNSRTQFAFSSQATAQWFSSLARSYYLLGFSHEENYTFEAPLLGKLHPRAKAYVINIDTFFDQAETAPGKTIMRDPAARSRYEEKQKWQKMQHGICTALMAVCGHDEAIFRSRSTGAWLVIGNRFPSQPVSYDDSIDQNKVASYAALGREFLPGLSAARACTILTVVPTVQTGFGTAQAAARALDRKLVAPKLAGLVTFDKVHLNPESAQRWSSAFLAEAGPQIRQCLSD